MSQHFSYYETSVRFFFLKNFLSEGDLNVTASKGKKPQKMFGMYSTQIYEKFLFSETESMRVRQNSIYINN